MPGFQMLASELNGVGQERMQRRFAAAKMQSIVRGFLQRKQHKKVLDRKRRVRKLLTVKQHLGAMGQALEVSRLKQTQELKDEPSVNSDESLNDALRKKAGICRTKAAKPSAKEVLATTKMQIEKNRLSRTQLAKGSNEEVLATTKMQYAALQESTLVIEYLLQQRNEYKEACEKLEDENVLLQEEKMHLSQMKESAERKLETVKQRGDEMKEGNQKLLEVLSQYKTRFTKVRNDLAERRELFSDLELSRRREQGMRRLCEKTLFDISHKVDRGLLNPSLRKSILSDVRVYRRTIAKTYPRYEDSQDHTSDTSESSESATSQTILI
jgi:hypothetical protein